MSKCSGFINLSGKRKKFKTEIHYSKLLSLHVGLPLQNILALSKLKKSDTFHSIRF